MQPTHRSGAEVREDYKENLLERFNHGIRANSGKILEVTDESFCFRRMRSAYEIKCRMQNAKRGSRNLVVCGFICNFAAENLVTTLQ